MRFDGGPIGVLINAGNTAERRLLLQREDVHGPAARQHDRDARPEGSAELDGALDALGVQRGTLPAYPPAPHCNTRGLTTLGRHVVAA